MSRVSCRLAYDYPHCPEEWGGTEGFRYLAQDPLAGLHPLQTDLHLEKDLDLYALLTKLPN